MTQSKKRIRQQAAVIEDLFAGALEEQEVLQKHHISPRRFEQWQTDQRFVEQFEQRIARQQRQSRIILARYAVTAAGKLVELTNSENQETARKACLDILTSQAATEREEAPREAPVSAAPAPVHLLSPEVASRLLAALAREAPRAETDSAEKEQSN